MYKRVIANTLWEIAALDLRKVIARPSMMSLAFFACAMVLAAIVVHLSAESIGLGVPVYSAEMIHRHLYLLVLGLASAALALVLSGALMSGATCIRRLRLIVADLPFTGRGLRFAGLCFGVQLGLFAASQGLEGCPISSGDAAAASITALVLCAATALVCGTLPKQMLLVLAIGYLSRLLERRSNPHRSTPSRFLRWIFRAIFETYQGVVGNRPPPMTTL